MTCRFKSCHPHEKTIPRTVWYDAVLRDFLHTKVYRRICRRQFLAPVYIKKKGETYEKSKKSYCSVIGCVVMYAATDGSADRGRRWEKTSGCIIYA